MARTYHADIARHVANAPTKWLDNILSHFDVPGVSGGRQGTARRITQSGVCHIVLIARLSTELGVRNVDAVAFAEKLLSGAPSIDIANGLTLAFDQVVFEREIAHRLDDAVEAVVPPRRGRPPNR